MRRNLVYITTILISILAYSAYGADDSMFSNGVPEAPGTFAEAACIVIKLSLDFIPYLVVIAVGFFIQGLIKYVGNGDSEEKRSEGRKMMIYGITGFFFMVSIWGILQLFTASFGLKLLIPQFNSDQTFKCDANVGGGSLNTINSNGLQGIHDLPNKNQIQA